MRAAARSVQLCGLAARGAVVAGCASLVACGTVAAHRPERGDGPQVEVADVLFVAHDLDLTVGAERSPQGLVSPESTTIVSLIDE